MLSFSMFAHGSFLFASELSNKLQTYQVSFVLRQVCCGSMNFCQIHLKSRANVSTTFSWAWYSVTRPVRSIFMNSLSRVTDVSTLKEAAKLPFQMRRSCPALAVISSTVVFMLTPQFTLFVSVTWFSVFRSSVVCTHSLVVESTGSEFTLWLCL